jgi:TIR domain
MMPEHACFISYVRGQYELMKSFVNHVTEQLQSSLEPYLGDEAVYIDQEQLQPGDPYPVELAQAICNSACMIVIYSPIYERHAYCLREYKAMEEVARMRAQLLGDQSNASKRMIIPIMLRGTQGRMLRAMQQLTHICDLSSYSTQMSDIRDHPDFIPEIERIALRISDLHAELEELDEEAATLCSTFELPPEEDVLPYLQRGRAKGFPK